MELGLLTSTQILTSLGVSTYMGSVELVMFGTNSLFGKNNMPTAVEFGIPVVPVVGSPLIAMARASLVTSHFDFVPVPAASVRAYSCKITAGRENGDSIALRL